MSKIILAALVAFGLSAFANEGTEEGMDTNTPAAEGSMEGATDAATTTMDHGTPGKKMAKGEKMEKAKGKMKGKMKNKKEHGGH